MSERPATSMSRGVCKYYTTPRGCFAGKHCKFLHGEAEKTTPFDKAKTCKFFAAGYCKRGSDCWFAHGTPSQLSGPASGSSAPRETATEEDENLCSICLEKPVTYGLLASCSHIYCIQCIRDWRDSSGKSQDMIVSGNTKKCPLCRAISPFVIPSSHFYPDGHEGKEATIQQYKASMARVPCRYFQTSPKSDRFCPFGRDCFYQHLNADGTPYVFDYGVSYYIKQRRRVRHSDEDEDDEDQSPWLQELSIALDAIRASVPSHIQHGHEDPERDDWIADAASEDEGSPAYARAQEALAQLASSSPSIISRSAISEPGSPTHTLSPIWGLQDGAPMVHPPLMHSTEPLPPLPPFIHTSGSRFSTTVRDRLPDFVLGRPMERNGLHWSTGFGGLQAELAGAFSVSDQHPPVATPTSNDLELLILLNPPAPLTFADESAQETRVTDTPTNDSSGAQTAPFPSPPDGWDASALPMHDTDPPLLTDGRGRVVWSTTAASRRGRGRAASATVPVTHQHKARLREDADSQEAALDQTRSPPMVRSRTLPEYSNS